MSATLVTQCPHCQTRFRLSQEHLRAAAGNVRCGACLKVFNANPPAENEQPVNEAVKALPEQKPRAKTRLDDVLIHDDLELDDLDLEDLGLDESIIDEVNPAPPPRQSSLPAASTPAEPEPAKQAATAAASQPEHSAAPAFNAIDSRPPDEQAAATHSADVPVTTTELAEPLSVPTTGHPASTAEPDSQSGVFLRDRPDPPTAAALPLDAGAEDEAPDTTMHSGLHAERDTPPAQSPQEKRREPLLGDDFLLPELDSEMLYLDEDQPTARLRRRNGLWSLLSLLALLGLIGQFGYFNFAALAHDERSRPVIASWCSVVGCQLPPQVDISLIRSSNLTVRPHPEYPNTLAIDVILYNRADFAQPFPLLRMRFSDQSDRELATRLFRPQEYLGGELAGARLMPAQTPIHVGLTMLAPEQSASSYRLDFLSPEQ